MKEPWSNDVLGLSKMIWIAYCVKKWLDKSNKDYKLGLPCITKFNECKKHQELRLRLIA